MRGGFYSFLQYIICSYFVPRHPVCFPFPEKQDAFVSVFSDNPIITHPNPFAMAETQTATKCKNPATFLHKYCRIFYTLFYLQTAMLFYAFKIMDQF